jgi:hypothetical protein
VISPAAPGLPPVRAETSEEALAASENRAEKAAQVRGVTSIAAMCDALRRVSRDLPRIDAVPRFKHPKRLDVAAFRARAEQGLPFLVEGVVGKWPLCRLAPQDLRERFGDVPVRARVGDYVGSAFAPDRPMRDMSLRAYLDLIAPITDGPSSELPPYVGNLELRALNGLCHWPAVFRKMGPARFWLGPAGTVTPLHCDYDDNVFAQIQGVKRILLAPPHHDQFLYPRQANAVLYGSPFDPEHPDFDAFPLARQAQLIECEVRPGDLLYLPAGWWHQVRALTFSLSANRWARALPLALQGDPGLLRAT